MAPDDSISSEAERRLYLDGIRLFNAQEYFDAHELWERVWTQATGQKREFFQGLIQASVAMEHFRRSNPRGVINLARRFREHLGRLPASFMGLDIRGFLAEMERALRPILIATPPPLRGQIQFDPRTAPKISLEPLHPW